jgi:hypothetical protein
LGHRRAPSRGSCGAVRCQPSFPLFFGFFVLLSPSAVPSRPVAVPLGGNPLWVSSLHYGCQLVRPEPTFPMFPPGLPGYPVFVGTCQFGKFSPMTPTFWAKAMSCGGKGRTQKMGHWGPRGRDEKRMTCRRADVVSVLSCARLQAGTCRQPPCVEC